MNNTKHSRNDHETAAAVLDRLTHPEETRSRDTVPFSTRPNPPEMYRMAVEKTDRMVPPVPVADQTVVRHVWHSWVVAKHAVSGDARTDALVEAVRAIARVEDAKLRTRLLEEQLRDSSVDLALEYESMMGTYLLFEEAETREEWGTPPHRDVEEKPCLLPVIETVEPVPESEESVKNKGGDTATKPRLISIKSSAATIAATMLVCLAINASMGKHATSVTNDHSGSSAIGDTSRETAKKLVHSADSARVAKKEKPIPAKAEPAVVRLINSRLNHADVPPPIVEDTPELALEKAEQDYGPHSMEVAITLSSIGISFLDEANYVEAQSRFRRALKIFQDRLGLEHEDTIATGQLLDQAVRMQSGEWKAIVGKNGQLFIERKTRAE